PVRNRAQSPSCIGEPETVTDDCVCVLGYPQGSEERLDPERASRGFSPKRTSSHRELDRRDHFQSVREHICNRENAIDPAAQPFATLKQSSEQPFQPGAGPSKRILLLRKIAAARRANVGAYELGNLGFQVEVGKLCFGVWHP